MIKKVCGECGGDIKEVSSFIAKQYSWWEKVTNSITIYQCKKCKDVFEVIN